MDQQAGTGSMHFENSFNGARQNAIGKGARVNIGAPGEAEKVNEAPANEPPTSDSIVATNAFNDASMNAIGSGAQVNVGAGALHRTAIPGEVDQANVQADQLRDRRVLPGAGARRIIISYSHKDRQWLDLLRIHLAPLEQQRAIDLWDDTRIAAGMHWRQAIIDALNTADVALLLVSANFLASDFITRYELPQILHRHSQGQISLLPLILSPCLFHESPLGRYQPFNLDSPLSMMSSSKRDDVLVRLAREIQQAFL